MDRLARNLLDLRNLVDRFIAKGIKVEFIKENVQFTGQDSPMSILLLNLLGAFAEFERSLIRERQREGIAIAKRAGKYKGRKPVLIQSDIAGIRERIAGGISKARIARELGISRQSLYKYLDESVDNKGDGENLPI
jgi:DNA invertase Pin-like site-specific DNA recombinase